MNVTRDLLENLGACSEAKRCFAEHNEFHTEATEALRLLLTDKWQNVIAEEYGDDSLCWANWLVTRLLTHEQRVRYAIFAAEQVIYLFEKKYPKDERPRQAIKAAKACLANTNTDTRAAADASANAAGYAARAAAYTDTRAAADASANAAGYAARAAAYAAADAANAAAYAAGYAARAAARAADAANAAGYDQMITKIVQYGIRLIEQVAKTKEGNRVR